MYKSQANSHWLLSRWIAIAMFILALYLAACAPVSVATNAAGPDAEGFNASESNTGESNVAEAAFYYHNGEPVPLVENPDKSYVLFEPEITAGVAMESLGANEIPIPELRIVDPVGGTNLELVVAPQFWAIIDNTSIELGDLDQEPAWAESIEYSAPFYFTLEGQEVGISHLFYVKLRHEADVSRLQELAEANQVEILANNEFMPLWYTLASSQESAGNALEMANLFYESGHFAAAEPDLLVDFQPVQPAVDTFFDRQWGLVNTGQTGGHIGIDINADDAWGVHSGDANILVAVLDHGVELDHPDMPNLSPLSFDTVSNSSPSVIWGNHGTACAGIVGASRNNGIGIAGVAPDVTLMSVSERLVLSPNAAQRLANGLNWAWRNGAHVISNSWGHNNLASPLIDDAIEAALQQGRNGLGTVVVFATGNANGAVIYPANSNPGILTVGAMSPCAERTNPFSCDGERWGSNFGSELDVVAPGVLIATTDRQGSNGYDSGDYTMGFNGTSSATPHVAGVAALILSVNPNLSQGDVVAIIERNTRKVGSYTYANHPGRGNGTWNNEMGYGLVDAFASVQAAGNLLSSGNLLRNSSFEQDPQITETEWHIQERGTDLTAAWTDEQARTGTQALSLRAGTTGSRGWPGWFTTDTFPLQPNQEYTFSVWAYSPAGQAQSGISIDLYDDTGRWLGGHSSACREGDSPPADQWYQIQRMFNSGDERFPNAVQARLGLQQCVKNTDSTKGEAAALFYDDVFFGIDMPE